MWWRKSALELRVDAFMERVDRAGGDHVRLVPVLEEYLRLAEDEGAGTEGFFFDVGAWSQALADSYLALGRVDDAVRVIAGATRGGHCEGAELLYELAEKLMRSGCEPQGRGLWRQARADFPGDVWICVQAGIEYGDLGDHRVALTWLTPGWSWRYEQVTPRPLWSNLSRCERRVWPPPVAPSMIFSAERKRCSAKRRGKSPDE